MGQFFRVNGDYNIKVRDGGTIKLDTGSSGDTIITGNLTVQGDVTSVSTTNLEIEDRIITLNDGENGPGVSLLYSGIEIDRGTYTDSTIVPRAALVWNETNPPSHSVEDTEEDPTAGSGYWMFATGQEGIYGFRDSNVKLRRILTDASTDSGDLTLIGTGSGVVKVKGTTNYRLQVTDDDDIPNKDYVDYSILNNPTFQIRAPQGQDTRVIIADRQVTPDNEFTGGSLEYYRTQTGALAETESTIGFFVDGVLAANIYADRVQLQQLEFDQTEILTVGSGNANIKFTPYGTGKVEVNGWNCKSIMTQLRLLFTEAMLYIQKPKAPVRLDFIL
jgi:hypothetical protein